MVLVALNTRMAISPQGAGACVADYSSCSIGSYVFEFTGPQAYTWRDNTNPAAPLTYSYHWVSAN